MITRVLILMVLCAVWLAVPLSTAQSQGFLCQSLVNGVQPAPDPFTAFWVVVQVERGTRAGEWTDYHEYEQTSAGWCDMSRPGSVRACQVDVTALLIQIYRWCVVEYIEMLPAWADWDGWPGQGQPGYTSIDVYLDARFYDGATGSHLTLACDVSPDQMKAVCLRQDRADHFNYIMAEPDPILALVNGWTQ